MTYLDCALAFLGMFLSMIFGWIMRGYHERELQNREQKDPHS